MAEFVEVMNKFRKIMDDAGRKGGFCAEINCINCPIENSLKVCDFRDFILEQPKEFEKFVMNYEPPVDWSKVAVDTPIYVKCSGINSEHKRHFAKYEDGKIFAFEKGLTSFTGDRTTCWDFARLAKEV